MKLVNILAILAAMSFVAIACDNGGGNDSDDASAQCENWCDSLDECIDDFPADGCNDLCDEVDDAESDFSGNCEEAIADLFDCMSDFTCGALEEIAEAEIDDIDDLLMFGEACEDAVEDIIDECDIDEEEEGPPPV